MSLCLFLHAAGRAAEAPAQVAWIDTVLRGVEGVTRQAVHVPASLAGGDPFLAASEAPRCVIQLYFATVEALEAALHPGTSLAGLLGVHGWHWTQQAMLVRRFTVPSASPAWDRAGERVSYLVAYEGHAEDNDAWLGHYLRQHPALMAQLPGVREVEVYTRLDYCSQWPAARADALQRNKVVFDTRQALSDALASPLRERLREDFLSLPPFSGASPHHAMHSLERLRSG